MRNAVDQAGPRSVLSVITPALIIFALSMLFLVTSAPVAVALTIELAPENVGIGSMNWEYGLTDSDIIIYETWNTIGIGLLIFNDVDGSEDYTITKIITNDTGVDWDRFANELLDPAGGADDSGDEPTPSWVPAGFSRSNDGDGLSFAQGSGVPRESDAFSQLVADELDTIDFLDFFDGTVSGAGGTDTVTFGLRDYWPEYNQPFLLAERPNESSVSIPDASTLFLLASACLVGLSGTRRRFAK